MDHQPVGVDGRRQFAGEGGSTSIAYTMAVAMSMVAFVLCANVIAALYGRGVVRGALDEGVRAGSAVISSAAECRQRISDVLDQLLGGAMGQGVSFDCEETTDAVVATAEATFPGWLPGVPSLSFDLGARAVKEPAA